MVEMCYVKYRRRDAGFQHLLEEVWKTCQVGPQQGSWPLRRRAEISSFPQGQAWVYTLETLSRTFDATFDILYGATQSSE